MKPCIDVIGPARCTGCFGCQSACVKGAIQVALDLDGFYKPIVDREICNECGVCQRRCPVIAEQHGVLTAGKSPEPKAFAAWACDEQVRLASSSGGVFSELARKVINAGSAVAGCVWGENWTPEHILTRDWSDIERMRGSKYVPSRVGDIYRQVIAALRDDGNTVLFTGTPCQVAAMEAALAPEQRERVILVEFICHGVPSLRVFQRYLAELFRGESVDFYTFRDKTLGWQTIVARSASGRRYRSPTSRDAFYQGFAGQHLYLMESCRDCPFARLPRGGDITIGDFWRCPETWYDRRGVSVAMANTQVGMRELDSLRASGRIRLEPTNVATIVSGNPRLIQGQGCYSVPNTRRAFLDDLAREEPFVVLKKKYIASRGQLWWNSFLASDSKCWFLASFVFHSIRRLLESRKSIV